MYTQSYSLISVIIIVGGVRIAFLNSLATYIQCQLHAQISVTITCAIQSTAVVTIAT